MHKYITLRQPQASGFYSLLACHKVQSWSSHVIPRCSHVIIWKLIMSALTTVFTTVYCTDMRNIKSQAFIGFNNGTEVTTELLPFTIY